MPKDTKPRSTEARSGPLFTAFAKTPVQAQKASGRGKSTDISAETSKPSNQVHRANPSAPLETEEPKSRYSESYLLQIQLRDTYEPVISRLLCVRSSFTFLQLHRALQVAFGWAKNHLFSFRVRPPLEEYQDRGMDDEILTLVKDEKMKDMFPDPEMVGKAEDFTLATIYDGAAHRGNVEVEYEYDPSNRWIHDITLLGRADPSLREAMHIPDDVPVFCLGGEGHPCAEDCGSSLGWAKLKLLFKTGEDPEGLREWYKTTCANGDPEGLEQWQWNILEVNYDLAEQEW